MLGMATPYTLLLLMLLRLVLQKCLTTAAAAAVNLTSHVAPLPQLLSTRLVLLQIKMENGPGPLHLCQSSAPVVAE